jgi:hypothetical protein
MFVIVNKSNGKVFKKPGQSWNAQYATKRGAKIAINRFGLPVNTFLVMTVEQQGYYYPTKMVERTNLMTGKKFMEAEDTPNFCSPASEAYWSM